MDVKDTEKTFSKLESGIKYDFKVVAHGTINGKTVDSDASAVVSATSGN